ncbi:hypothetical protein AAHA92_18405 [Salvia divinorum]|uniref:Uncharacterized protein n=1 Tax=Salvia divinorum TaxID=28513 RepID=A0ABD1H208_SALDI
MENGRRKAQALIREFKDSLLLLIFNLLYFPGLDSQISNNALKRKKGKRNGKASYICAMSENLVILDYDYHMGGGGKGKYEAGSSGSKDPEKQSG